MGMIDQDTRLVPDRRLGAQGAVPSDDASLEVLDHADPGLAGSDELLFDRVRREDTGLNYEWLFTQLA